MVDKLPTPTSLPNELWVKTLSYVDTNDLLHSVSLVSRSFLNLSSDDSIWYDICKRRWECKLNVYRFYVRDHAPELNQLASLNISNDAGEGQSVDGSTPLKTHMTYCSELIRQFGDPKAVPSLNMGSLMHEPASWKESYWMAELDSCRETISREELVYFKFQLIYMGNPSRLGLRKFNRDGFYDSPYMGRSEWILHGQHLLFAGMSLLVERDKKNWGWIIGRGERTEYLSVEVEETMHALRSNND
jgi:hypothetical protein